MSLVTRRRALFTGLGGGGLLLAGCSKIIGADSLTQNEGFLRVIGAAEGWNLHSQRLLQGGGVALAKEYSLADLSPHFKPNGTLQPGGDFYAQQTAQRFANWTVRVDGLVARPITLTIPQLRALPARTQITKHDCVEGWTAIGQWTGPQLGMLLKAAQPLPQAKYAVFYCADNLEGEPAKGGEQAPGQYYESLDLVDCYHPQTILAHTMNGRPLDVPHGAPVRLRVERQLGYKQAKYVQRIQLVSAFGGINGGKGGYWEDRGYEWYAGI